MVMAYIDNYHNIHTNHGPSLGTQTNVAHMATLLVKSLKNVKAINSIGPDDEDQNQANTFHLQDLLLKSISSISKSYVNAMPDWLQAQFFDLDSQRSRLLAHVYQDDIMNLRSMDNCKLSDCVELPFKSYEDFQIALSMMLEQDLSFYLGRFLVPLVRD